MTEEELYINYKGICFPKAFHSPESMQYFEGFSFQPDDIIIATYPKTGTTWTQDIVPLIESGGDPATVETLPSYEGAPWLEETRPSGLNKFVVKCQGGNQGTLTCPACELNGSLVLKGSVDGFVKIINTATGRSRKDIMKYR